jgi:flagellar biosynthesis component FlhA
MFEALLDAGGGRDARDLAETVRRVLVPQQLRRDGVGRLRPLIVAPHFEAELAAMWTADGGLAPEPLTALHVRETITRFVADGTFAPHALVVTAPLRPLIAEFLDRVASGLAVYAYGELPPELVLEPAAVIAAPPARALAP